MYHKNDKRMKNRYGDYIPHRRKQRQKQRNHRQHELDHALDSSPRITNGDMKAVNRNNDHDHVSD
ncbi:hypothetical protein D3C78_1439700 [compost metagenome]